MGWEDPNHRCLPSYSNARSKHQAVSRIVIEEWASREPGRHGPDTGFEEVEALATVKSITLLRTGLVGTYPAAGLLGFACRYI